MMRKGMTLIRRGGESRLVYKLRAFFTDAFKPITKCHVYPVIAFGIFAGGKLDKCVYCGHAAPERTRTASFYGQGTIITDFVGSHP